MRRAEWRRRANDPTTLLGWWWRGVQEEGGWLLPAMFAWVAAASFLLPLPWGPAVAMAGYILYGGLRTLWSRDELRPLLADPAPEGQFRATATYRRKGLTLGRDAMAITVADGWLVGEGLRTDFALRPKDVWAWDLRYERGAKLTLTDETEIRLSWCGESSGLLLSRWRSSKGPVEGQPVFPPAEPHAQEIARWTAWSFLGVGWIGLPGVIFTLVFGRAPSTTMIALASVGLGILLWTQWRLKQLLTISNRVERQGALDGQVPALQRAAFVDVANSPVRKTEGVSYEA